MTAILVRDVMTKDVVTARTTAPFRTIATTMIAHDIGALPVVDETGHPIGIVSRTDLIAKEPAAEGVRAEAWELLTPSGRGNRDRRRADTAGRLMTTDLVTVTADSAIARAAFLMRRRAVTHLPVVDERDVLVGIVSRSDLLRAFLRDDAEIREDVIRDVLLDGLDADRDSIEVAVDEGVVILSGTLDFATSARYAVRLARGVPGVVDVVNKLDWHTDDTDAVACSGFGSLY